MAEFNEIEMLYVKDRLLKWGVETIKLFRKEIKYKRLRIGDVLIESLRPIIAMEGYDPKIEFAFYGYGRAIEIEYFKKQKLNVWQKPLNQTIWGTKENRQRKKKKNTQWYSRTVYGRLNNLISVIGTEYSEQEIARLKKIFLSQTEGITNELKN